MMGIEDPPDLLPSDLLRYHLVVEWWMQLEQSGDIGRTTWKVLDRLRNRVTDALALRPRQLVEAESATAEAAMRINGDSGQE